MRIVAALGGNALLKRGEQPTIAAQRANARIAAEALAPLAKAHELILTHGNGPQVGLLALQAAEGDPDQAAPLDVLDSETEGMIGYLVMQELANALVEPKPIATVLTQVEVDPDDPAFVDPSKPVGPIYAETEARRIAAERGWTVKPDGAHFRRVVASPRPKRIIEAPVIEALVDDGVIAICAGGGGIPVRRREGRLEGVEAVIDKDRTSGLLAAKLRADLFMMLTDVPAVFDDWAAKDRRAITRASPYALAASRFAAGSMRPKVEAACRFAAETGGRAAIGALADAGAIARGQAGTQVCRDVAGLVLLDVA